MGVTEKLAKFIVETNYNQMPADAVARAKIVLLDAVGVALAGTGEPAVKILTAWVKKQGGKPVSGVIGGKFRTSAPYAALINGTLSHVLDYDDSGLGQSHIGVVLMPIVLAMAEEHGSSGEEIVEAFVVGAELIGKIGDVLVDLHAKGWHPTSVFGTIGGTAAAAKLMKLDLPQTIYALGIAGSQASGLFHNSGTYTKSFHAGNAARAAIAGAELAKAGWTACVDVFDHEAGYPNSFYGMKMNTAAIGENLGNPFGIVKPSTNIKKYPVCYAVHKSVDALLDLIKKYDIKPDDVESVNCQVWPPYIKMLFYSDPRTGLEGKFSMQFAIACALVYRTIGLALVTDEVVKKPEIKALMKKVTMGPNPVWKGGEKVDTYPDKVTLKLKNGQEYVSECRFPKGHAEAPLNIDEMMVKYRDCAKVTLSDKDTERSAELMATLEKQKDVKKLMEIVTGK